MADPRICSILECGKPHEAKGYCSSHYQRLRIHGNPLVSGTTPGDPMRFINDVAMHHTSSECLIWPFSKVGAGYGRVWIDGKQVVVSRYICQLVHGAPPTIEHDASHSCGKGHEGCISPIHLSWKTRAENEADKLIHGTHIRGGRHGRAKLTETEASEILAMKGKETQRNLAERFGVSIPTVSHIHTGRKWAWLAEESAA